MLDTSSVQLRAHGNVTDGYGADGYIPIMLWAPDVSDESASEYIYTWYNDGTWPLGDMNGRFNQQGGYSIFSDIIPSCQSVDGRLAIGFYGQRFGYSRNEECNEFAQNVSTVNVNHTLPNTNIVNQTGPVEATSDTVRWNVQIQNAANVNGGYVFIGFEDSTSQNLDVIGLRDVGADTIIPLTPYTDGVWAVVDESFPAQMAATYEVTALITGCQEDEIRAITGYECDGIPDSPNDYACGFESVMLAAVPLRSRVQIRLNQSPAPYDLCTAIEDTIVVTSAERAYIDNVRVFVPLPQGLSEDDGIVQIEYSRGSGQVYDATATVSNDTIQFDLSEHPNIGQQGIAGTADALTQADREVAIVVTWVTDCSFVGGSPYSPYVLADRPCGDPAIGNGASTTSDNLVINGATPTSATVFEPDVSPQTVVGCDDVMVGVETNIFIGETTDRDSIKIGLPRGLVYEPGSFVCTAQSASYQGDCPTFVRVDSTEEGGQTLVLKIPGGVTAPKNFSLALDAMTVPGEICNGQGIITFIATTSNDGISCPSSPGMVCNNFTVITGQAADTLTFLKQEVTLRNFMACTDPDSFIVSGTVIVDTLPLATGDSLRLELFCPETPDVVLDTIYLAGEIMPGDSVSILANVSRECVQEQLSARILAEGDNCICEDAMISFDITPEVMVFAGSDETVCSNRPYNLAGGGANVSDPPAEADWSTDGDGTFLDANGQETALFTEAVEYEPGEQDRANGCVTLTLTATSELGCADVSDSLLLTLLKADCGSFPWGGAGSR